MSKLKQYRLQMPEKGCFNCIYSKPSILNALILKIKWLSCTIGNNFTDHTSICEYYKKRQ